MNSTYQWPLESVIDSVLGGIWAPQCAGISRTAARIINTYSGNLHATVVETAYLDHTLNIIAFERGGERFSMILLVRWAQINDLLSLRPLIGAVHQACRLFVRRYVI